MSQPVGRLAQDLLRSALRSARRSQKSSPIVIAVLVIALFALGRWLRQPDEASTTYRPAAGATLNCRVTDVYDGDTVTARCPDGTVKVRVYGIDAPEMGQKPWGPQSRDRLRDLLTDPAVQLKVEEPADRYGRVVARLIQDNRDVGLELVRQGGAVVYSQYNDSSDYRDAQVEAKRYRRGVWARPGAQQQPWEWRRLNPR